MPAAKVHNEFVNDAVQRAADAVGGQSALARLIRVKPQSVQLWCATGRPPIERMLQIEAATGVPWQELRPDLAGVFTGVLPAARQWARDSICDLV